MSALETYVDGRPILATREGASLRLSFRYRKDLVDKVRQLPFATFDKASKTWTVGVYTQTLETLRRWYYDGLIEPYPDELLDPDEQLDRCPDAVLRHGSTRRPFLAVLPLRDDRVFQQLKSLPGAQWEKKARGLSFPPAAAAGLAELADRGRLDDPDGLLTPAETTVMFDTRTGRFAVRGEHDSAAVVFKHHFPSRDVVAIWRERGHDVAFVDDLTEEIYHGEIARAGPGLQPDNMRLELFPYQQLEVATAITRTGFALLSEPGVGKTPPALGTAMEALNRGYVSRVVVVVPSSLRSQWANETVRFCKVSHADVVVVAGTKKQRYRAYERARHARFVIVHYDVLTRDLEMLQPLVDSQMLVLDEAHRVKGYTSKRSKSARALGQLAARRLAMSGTPIENNPGEWYQLIGNFVAPGSLGSPDDFLSSYMYPGAHGGYAGARNVAELRARTKVHYSRFTKAQVAEHLPPLRVQNVVLDPDPAYAKVLRRAHRDARKMIADQRLASADAAWLLRDPKRIQEVQAGSEMTAVGMLRALCSSPRLLESSDSDAAKALQLAGIVPPDTDGPKLAELRQIASDLQSHGDRRRGGSGSTVPALPGERVVVFTYSRRMADLISQRLDEDGIRHVTYTGSTSRADRDAAVAAFTDPASDVTAFVATDAAAEGLNLGRCCNLLINFDVPWNPSTLIQRGNRIHRVDGTADSYLVLNFTLAQTLEAGILKLLERKVDLSDAILGEHGGKVKTVGKQTSLASLLREAFAELDGEGGPAAADSTPSGRSPVSAVTASGVGTEPDAGAATGGEGRVVALPSTSDEGGAGRPELWHEPEQCQLELE